MQRNLLLASIILVFAAAANAQITTVTGTVTDSTGIPYSAATVKAQIVIPASGGFSGQPTVTVSNATTCNQSGFGSAPCNIPFEGTHGPITLDGAGKFTLNVEDNSLVRPPGTQWLFTVDSPGSPLPLGTGPQTCTATLTISGGSQSVSANFAACPNLSNVAGGSSILPSNNTFTGTNDFTNTTFFDADSHTKGPNPWADVSRFGGYFGAQTPPSTTGSITSGLNALTMAAAQDFLNGHGILVLGAGPATSLSTPTWGTVSITAWSITANVATFTATNSLLAGQTVTLSGFATGAFFNGQQVTVSATGLSGSQFQAAFTHANGSTTEAGVASGSSITPWGATGSTAYSYCVAAEDYFGGRTPCGAAATLTNGVATLGIQTATILSCNRVSGIATCTTSSPHNFTAGAQVNIVKGSTGDATQRFEGVFSIFSTPTPTTFTFTQYGAADVSGTVTTGSAQVNATNLVRWNSDATNTVLRSYIYRCPPGSACALPANAANYSLAGVAVGVDGYFQDYGLAITAANVGNGDVPATAPTTATNTALSTTILSGGGTTALTLANNATTTVAGAKVLHDNSPNLVSACTSFTRGGIVYIPASNVAANYFPINSPFKFSSCPGGTQLQINNKVFANAPIIMSSYDGIQGLPSGRDVSVASPTFYDFRPQSLITGFGYPFIYFPGNAGNGMGVDDLLLQCNQTYMPCIYQDEQTNGNSPTSIRYRHVHANSGGPNTPWVVKGGFGLFWEFGGWANGATSFASPPGMLFSPNCGLANSNQQQSYLVVTKFTYGFNGTVFDACNQVVALGLNNFTFQDMLGESNRGPMFRFGNTGGVGTFNGTVSWWELTRTNYADSLAGISTPVIDATMVNIITGLHIVSPGAPQGPLIETNSGGVNLDVSADYIGIVGAQFYAIPGAGLFSNIPVRITGAQGLLDVSAANVKMPVFPGFTSTATNTFGLDGTAQNIHLFANGVDNLVGLLPSTITPSNNNFMKWTVSGSTPTLNDYGGSIILPVNGGSGLASPTAHSILIGQGASNYSLITSPSVNGSYQCRFNVTAGAAVDPTCDLSGVAVLTPATPYTGAYSDRATIQRLAGGSTFSWTLPQITGNTAANMPIGFVNNNSGLLTLTANAADKVNNSATGGTYTALPLTFTFLYQDSTSAPGNWWPITLPQITAFPACADSAGNHINFTSAAGFTCGTSSSGGSSVWSALTAPAGNLSLAMAGNLSAFNTTTPLAQFFSWKNTTAAVVGTSQGSPVPALCGRAWTGADAEDCMTWQDVPGNGANAPITFIFGHTGTSTGQVDTTFPGPVKSGGSTAGFIALTQNPTSSANADCNLANTKCYQAGVALTANIETLAPATAQGTFAVTGNAAATNEMYSGDAGHSTTVTTGSGTSIGSTSLCSTANCPVGTYVVNAYLDITTACTTTGTYSVSLVYTDDQGSKTIVIPMQGPGETAGVLNLATVTNFGQAAQVLRSTGAASINYLTTAAACGSGGPMVGKLYLSVVPVQ